jgi:predicted RNA-binding protein with PIN domain
MPYIVDGNNLMGQTPGWHRDKSRARRNLIRNLAIFARVKKARVTVVFDGAPDTEFPEGTAYQGVKVLYAERGSNADSRILKLVENATHPRGLSVVTSDRQLGFLAHSSGAKIIRSGEFRKLLVQLQEEPNRDEKDSSKVDLDQWLRYFGSTPEDDDDLDRS